MNYFDLQVAGEMASAGLQRMMAGYEREKGCSDLKEPKGFICVSSTGFAGGAPSPDLSGASFLSCAWQENIDGGSILANTILLHLSS